MYLYHITFLAGERGTLTRCLVISDNSTTAIEDILRNNPNYEPIVIMDMSTIAKTDPGDKQDLPLLIL